MKIETKYNLNQEVWFITHNRIKNGKIFSINIYLEKSETTLVYNVRQNANVGDNYYEDVLFNTKEELISSL